MTPSMTTTVLVYEFLSSDDLEVFQAHGIGVRYVVFPRTHRRGGEREGLSYYLNVCICNCIDDPHYRFIPVFLLDCLFVNCKKSIVICV